MAKPKTTAKLLLNSVDNNGNTSLSTSGTRSSPKSRLTNWNIQWGDGASYQGLGAPDPTLNHKYATPGRDYQPTLSVFDNRGDFDSDMIIVRVPPSGAPASPPVLVQLVPNSGSVGDSCIINGSNFGSTQGTSKVYFNGVLVISVTSWASGSITCIVPAGATTGQVTVVVANQSSNGLTYTISAPSSFTYFIKHPNDGGNDANNGLTPGTAWATVAHAAGIVLPGQSVGIFPSSSFYTERLLTWPSGSAGNTVLISGTDPNDRPRYKAAADISNYVFRVAGCNFLNIRDILIDYTNVPALGLGGRVEDSTNILLQRVRLTNLVNGINSPDDGQLITVGGSDSVTDTITMLDCEVDHNGDTIATNFQHGIYVLNATNMVQDGCYVHDNGAYGTQYFWGSAPNDQVHNGAIIRNGRYTRNGRSGALVSRCNNGQVYNNRFYGNGIGLLGSGGGGVRWGASGVSNGKCWFNSAYDNHGNGSQGNFWAGAESSNIEFRNNISRNGNPNYQNDGSGTVQDHNFNFGAGQNADPLWADPNNGDFHLTSSVTPGFIGVAVAITVDAAGNPRPNPPSVGCFEP